MLDGDAQGHQQFGRCPFAIHLRSFVCGYSAFDCPCAVGAVKAFGMAIPIAILVV